MLVTPAGRVAYRPRMADNQGEPLLVERAGGIVRITFNRPARKNAITHGMWNTLFQTCREIAKNPDDRVVILTGTGDAFSSGADLGGGDDGAPRPRHQLASMRDVNEAVLAVHRLPQPTIARINGVAAGVGLNLALACDLTVASDEARFSEIFARRGLSLDGGGSWILPRLIGLHRAKQLAFFADVIPASEAAELGLVNRVVPAADLDKVVDEWAARLAAGPPIALSQTKELLNASFQMSLEQALEAEARTQTVNFGTADTTEAITAFVQKRDPSFEGR